MQQINKFDEVINALAFRSDALEEKISIMRSDLESKHKENKNRLDE